MTMLREATLGRRTSTVSSSLYLLSHPEYLANKLKNIFYFYPGVGVWRWEEENITNDVFDSRHRARYR